MTSFHEIRMPANLASGFTGGPNFHTTLMALGSGYEKRNIDWSRERRIWTLTHWMESALDIAAFQTFFMNRYGRAYGFRFQDLADYQITPWQNIGVGDGSNKLFQIFKAYSDGTYTFNRIIAKPVTGTVQVRVNGSPLTEGPGASKFTVDYTTGIITIGSAPAPTQPVDVQCQFDVPVRFDTDKLDINMTTLQIANLESVTIVELKT